MISYKQFKANLKGYRVSQALLADNMLYCADQIHSHGNLVPLSEMHQAIGVAMQKALKAYCVAVWPTIKLDGDTYKGAGLKGTTYTLPLDGKFYAWERAKAEPKPMNISKTLMSVCVAACKQSVTLETLESMLKTSYAEAYKAHADAEAERLAHEAKLMEPIKAEHSAQVKTLEDKLEELQRKLAAIELEQANSENQKDNAGNKKTPRSGSKKDKNGQLRPVLGLQV